METITTSSPKSEDDQDTLESPKSMSIGSSASETMPAIYLESKDISKKKRNITRTTLVILIFIILISVISILAYLISKFTGNKKNISNINSAGMSGRLYRSYDGTNNNINKPLMGSAPNYYSRSIEGHLYDIDGNTGNQCKPVQTRPSPRIISNRIAAADSSGKGPRNGIGVNLMELFFGQFINHDLEGNGFELPIDFDQSNLVPQTPDYPLPPTDPLYPTLMRRNGNPRLLQFKSQGIIDDNGVFQVKNNNTGWIDLSTVYGSSKDVADRLRSFVDGKLKTRDYNVMIQVPVIPIPGNATAGIRPQFVTLKDYPPPKSETQLMVNPAILTETIDGRVLPSSPVSQTEIFTFGDSRGQENAVLLALQVAFLREHNKIADKLKLLKPNWDDNTLFEESRRRNIAQYQKIVMYDYLPLILNNNNPVPEYNGYDDTIDADTTSLFAGAAFRYGHSSVTEFGLINKCIDWTSNLVLYPQTPPGFPGLPNIFAPSIPGAGQFGGLLSPAQSVAYLGDLGTAIRSAMYVEGGKIDIIIDDVLRNIDFFVSAVDLFASDIDRGRNNGVPDYYTVRKIYRKYPLCQQNDPDCDLYYGLTTSQIEQEYDDISLFTQITSNITLATELRNLYKKVNNIDAIVGLFVEDFENPIDLLPPTLQNVILKQYISKRDGDRFWYENKQFNNFNKDELDEIQSTTLADILERNLDIDNLPKNIFLVPPFWLRHGRSNDCPN